MGAFARADGGVDVGGFAAGDPEGRMVHSPDHPLEDEDGCVRLPDLDMATQMSQLVMAQRGYQASVQVTGSAQDIYSAALQIEALSVRASVSKDLDGLVEAARSALEPALAAPYVVDGVLHAISFDPLLEQQMLEGLRPTEQGTVVVLDPDAAQRVLLGLTQAAQAAENTDVRPVLVCAPALRAAVRRLVAPAVETEEVSRPLE